MTDDRRSGAGSSGRKGRGPEGSVTDGCGEDVSPDGAEGPAACRMDRQKMRFFGKRWFRRSLFLRWVAVCIPKSKRGDGQGVTPDFPAMEVPSHRQDAFRRVRLRMLRLLLPLHLLAQAVSAPVVALGIWSSSRWLAVVPCVAIEGALLVWVCGVQPRLRGRGKYSRLDDRSLRWALRLLNGGLGLVWFVFIILAFRLQREDAHLLTLGVCFGLMAPLLLCSVVTGAVEAMMVPIVAGLYGALLEDGFHHSVLFTVSFFLTVTVCGFFVAGISRLVGTFLYRMQMARLNQREQADILSLLTRRSVPQGGGWLWETDEAGMLRPPFAGLGRMLGRDEADVAGWTLERLLELPAVAPEHPWPGADLSGAMSPERHLAHCLTNRLAFRELAVRVATGAGGRWWMLTGQPVFRAGVFQGYRGMGTDVTALQAMRKRHFHRVRVDGLTGLPNRLACLEYVQQSLLETARGAQAFVIVLVSLDLSGAARWEAMTAEDAAYVLQVSAARLGVLFDRDAPEGRDRAENRFLARHGMRDLAVVMEVPADRRGRFLEVLALEILSVLRRPVEVPGGCAVEVEAAIGMAVSTVGDGDALVEAAERALQDARRERVGRYSIFDPCADLANSRQKSLFREVRQALRLKAFVLVYQPIANARTGQVIGFEALCRWKGSAYGHLSIEKVIDMIVETGNGLEFDSWVLETACRVARHWPAPLWVSVNMTATHFSLPDIADRIFAVLEKVGLDPRRLQIEVTETQALEAGPPVYHAFRELERRGVRMALDDFGKGFSTLMYLRQFPFSKIKLDAAFIQDMLQDARSAAVVRNVIELAVDLGIAVTAEGVSSPEHYRHLQERGCTEVQGFFLGRPVPEEDVPLCWGRLVPDLW